MTAGWRPDLVVFDCDGVLVDTERLAVRIDVEVMADLGWVMTEADVVELFMGRSEADIRLTVEQHLGRRLPDDWDEPYRNKFQAAVDTELEAVDGVVAVLDALDAAAVATCVASSGTHGRMRHTLGVTGLLDRLAGRIFSAEEVPNGKPAPDLFLHAARSMGVDPVGCVVVEDSPFGLRGAQAAGMRTLAFAAGMVPIERLRVGDAVVFEHMSELPRLLGIA